MKQQTKPKAFTIDKPILSGFIYMIQQGDVRKVCSKGSLERMNLEGEWKVVKQFENTDK